MQDVAPWSTPPPRPMAMPAQPPPPYPPVSTPTGVYLPPTQVGAVTSAVDDQMESRAVLILGIVSVALGGWTPGALPYAGAGILLGLALALLSSAGQGIAVVANRLRKRGETPEAPLFASSLLVETYPRQGVQIQLRPDFQFLHEPISFREPFRRQDAGDTSRFVGREEELREFIQRILLSDGGAFLVAGYRGVGKTSFVNRVIQEIQGNLAWLVQHFGPMDVLDISLNIARPLTPLELMHHIIRGLYSRLEEKGLLDRLDPADREALLLAYQRTSFTISRKAGGSTERSLGIGDLLVTLPSLGIAPKLSGSIKRTRTENLDMNFMTYDDKAAEYDISRLSRRLARGYFPPASRLRRAWQRLRRKEAERVKLKIIFVFDELDKLENFKQPNGVPVIDDILGTLKNLFTTSGMTFIFVAGKDLHDRWREDVGRGDSVYESIFAYNKYLPAMWDGTARICTSLVENEYSVYQDDFRTFQTYLEFKGRGIPRRILRAFNQYVHWNGRWPYLHIDYAEMRRIRFYAELQKVLEQERVRLMGEIREEVRGEWQDQRRLGIYYIIDWILLQNSRSFAFQEVVAASQMLSSKILPVDGSGDNMIRALMDVLLAHQFLEKVEASPDQVIVGDASAAPDPRYRVPRRRVLEMGSELEVEEEIPRQQESYKSAGGVSGTIGKYRIVRRLAQGGMSEVYLATDMGLNRAVALKILHQHLINSSDLARLFQREGQLLAQFNHPHLVRLFDLGESEGRYYLALEYIEGVDLAQIMKWEKKLSLDMALTVMTPIMEAVAYLHNKGIVRCDVKPGNIMISRTGNVYQIDLGIAKFLGNAGSSTGSITGSMIGTPQYMAPEQAQGKPIDGRADIYSLGIVLYQLLVGDPPFNADTVYGLIYDHISTPPVPPRQHDPSISVEIEQVIMRCIAKDPADRFSSVEELLAALPAYQTVEMASFVEREMRRIDSLDRRERDVTDMPLSYGAEPPAAPVYSHAMGAAPVGVYAEAYPQVNAVPGDNIQSMEVEQVSQTMAFVREVIGERIAARDEPLSGPFLEVLRGLPEVSRLKLPETGAFRIGRSLDNELVIDDDHVSRFHAQIEASAGHFVLRDLNSVLGLLVNGARVGDKALQNGDEIRIGDALMIFHDGAG